MAARDASAGARLELAREVGRVGLLAEPQHGEQQKLFEFAEIRLHPGSTL